MIKKKIKKIIQGIFPKVNFSEIVVEINNKQLEQRLLFLRYQELKSTPSLMPNFNDMGFRVYSQNDEDGKILFIFSLIGFTNKLCLDMAFATPYGSNTTNLILNWGFHSLLVEANDLKGSQRFFDAHKDSCIFPPKIVQSWITRENVNEICLNAGFEGEIDFFSLDMDGVDYYIWEALTVVQPRLVVVEYNDIISDTLSQTVPYDVEFDREHSDFFGASLKAFENLANKKGYRLIGTNQLGYNAFFLKNGIEEELLPKIEVNSCFKHPKVKEGMMNRYPKVKDLPWIKV
jgi:hypothetical protein